MKTVILNIDEKNEIPSQLSPLYQNIGWSLSTSDHKSQELLDSIQQFAEQLWQLYSTCDYQ